ncbi:MAG: hypothetical protein MN733_32600 [Nitrososphaera sp.]|nr:hypothetical protein [Nitrososphaera sp.]
MGQITIDQSHGVMAVLATHVDWSLVDFEQAGLQDLVIRDQQKAGDEFLLFLQNGCRVQVIGEHIIDCDATPFVPDGLTIEEHKKGGQIWWNPANFKPWLHPEQESGEVIAGHALREWGKEKPLYNACVLDYWLAHTEVIPLECKGKWTYFWGTIYRDSYGNLYIRCLRWRGERLAADYDGLVNDWDANCPAAGSAS